MRLTSLTLYGFKSFGERSVLEFAPGITAIIGPNGAGKSNLLEALRWASGGGRAGEFRAGDKTELIFHGASERRGLGYAEVALELKDESRRLHIARSLFRDGQSRLSLNGRSARFLDLEAALSGSGLGRGGLALIGQGEVSGVLMADPERLLGYVAEAAGVALLGSRRDQTRARLEAAREHLRHLEDLLAERRLQLQRLEAEARQAARAATLNREALQLRYTLSLRRTSGLESEIGALCERRAELKGALARAGSALEAAQARWGAARRGLQELEAGYRQAVAEAAARRGDLRLAEERLKGARARRQPLERELSAVEDELAQLEGLPPPSPPEGERSLLEAAAASARAELSAAQRAADEAGARFAAGDRALAAARAKAEAFESQRAALEAQLAEVRSRLEQAADGEGVEGALEAERAALAAAEGALAAARADLEGAQRAHAGAVAEAQALAKAASRSRHAFETRQGYSQGPREALSSGIPGVLGSVAELLRAPEAYALAVGSALGGRAQSVVVDGADTAQKVLERLKRRGGWVTLLPLDLVQGRASPPPPALAAEPDVIGPALDLVAFEGRYAGVFAQLLGNTLVVASLPRAVALARKYGQRPRLVTLQGELLEPSGAISGGKRQVGAGLLGAKAALEAAETAASRAQDEETRLARVVKEMQEAFRNCQSEVSARRDRFHALDTSLAARRSLLNELRARERDLQARLALLERAPDLRALETAREEAEAARAAAQGRVETASRRLFEARGLLSVFEVREQAYRAALARHREEARRRAGLQARREALREERRALLEALEGLEAEVRAAEAALPADLAAKEAAYAWGQQESGVAEAALASLSGARAAQGAELEELQLSLARREASYESARAELAAFPEGLAAREGSPRALREALAEAERELEGLGPVNYRAQSEFEAQAARCEVLASQLREAAAAVTELEDVLTEIDAETDARLGVALEHLRGAFSRHVAQLFGPGGQASIEVERREGRPTGLRIGLQPPGKRTRSLNLLSVGERTMGALAFLFALMSDQGLPLAILDEVDAPLDEANIRRFCGFLQRLSAQGTQFVLITHQKATMEVADVLWGVTTERGVSRVFSIAKAEHV